MIKIHNGESIPSTPNFDMCKAGLFESFFGLKFIIFNHDNSNYVVFNESTSVPVAVNYGKRYASLEDFCSYHALKLQSAYYSCEDFSIDIHC